jgi:hypothetical protein
MLLEAFFSTVACNVFVEIFKRAIDKKWKRLDEADVRRIIEDYLRQYHLAGQASVIKNEIVMILGNSGVLGSGGQLLLPSSHEIPALLERLPEVWWDTRVYKIVSVLSERALSVLDWRMDDSAPIVQWDYLDGANQQWRLIPVGGHGELFKIHSQHSAKVLDVWDWKTDNGAAIAQWDYHGGTNQRWRLTRVK